MGILEHNIGQIVRYGIVTVLSYVALLGGTYICVDMFDLPATPSYVAVLTLVYIGVYLSSSRYVFYVTGSSTIMKRFAVAVIFLWALNSMVFYVLETLLALHYLLAAIINIGVFGPLRFMVNKKWVFLPNTDAV